MADITLEDGFTYYEGDENSAFVRGGFTYIDDTSVTVEDGYTYYASGVQFFTFLLDD